MKGAHTNSQATSTLARVILEDGCRIPMAYQWPNPLIHPQWRLNTAWLNACQWCSNSTLAGGVGVVRSHRILWPYGSVKREAGLRNGIGTQEEFIKGLGRRFSGWSTCFWIPRTRMKVAMVAPVHNPGATVPRWGQTRKALEAHGSAAWCITEQQTRQDLSPNQVEGENWHTVSTHPHSRTDTPVRTPSRLWRHWGGVQRPQKRESTIGFAGLWLSLSWHF